MFLWMLHTFIGASGTLPILSYAETCRSTDMPTPKVYIDANVLKFSATELLRSVPKNKKIRNWYGKVTGILVSSPEYVNPNQRIRSKRLREEVDLLPRIAELAKNQRIRVLMNHETELETWGLPNMDSRTGRFYGASIEYVEGPVKCERVIAGFGRSAAEWQFGFMGGIDDKRFLELQKATGAYQGKNALNRNQLLDAFAIWCAEYGKCDLFLTLDFKLIRMMRKSKYAPARLTFVAPSELLRELDATHRPNPRPPLGARVKRWLSLAGKWVSVHLPKDADKRN